MFTVGSSLPIDGVSPGSTLLVVGPPMTGKRDLVLQLLAEGGDDEAIAVVSTDTSASEIRESLRERTEMSSRQLPLGVVDCVGDSHGTSGLSPLDSRVSSPADLTGIGMELTTLLERLYADHSTQLRLGLLSLTTMSMYASAEQVTRFLHVLTSRIREADAVGFVVAHSDTMDPEQLQRLRSFVDGVVEVREGETGPEIRVLGVESEPTDWTAFALEPSTPDGDEPTTTTNDRPVADSLRSIFGDLRERSPTLTICNYDGPPEAVAVVERYFDRHGITVRQASMDVDEPHSVALLHHGDDLLASESMTAIRGAIDIQSSAGEAFGERRTSDLLTQLDRSVFGAESADKSLLIDVSHTIELLANRNQRGRLHAGFQRLSNLVEDRQAARIYERLADSGVDVHVYGAPDSETTLSGVTVHSTDDTEIAESWFVVYDGAGDPERRAALLALEGDTDDTFEGFWTYDNDIVEQIDSYLNSTYLGEPSMAD